MATITQDLGAVTAYAYAVEGGYEGTEAEFAELLGNIAEDLAEIENLTVQVTTLPAGSSATASYADGVLYLGIPRGDKGDTGATGAAATIAVGTTTTLPAGSSATVTNSGTSSAATFNFGIPAGPDGNGIVSIYKTGTSGLVDTYTILFTDGNTTTFEVTNGEDGEVTEAQLTEAILSVLPTDTASGAIASFPDGYPTPALSVVSQIEPVQDLHGYANPWPPGGGKNLIDDSKSYHQGDNQVILGQTEGFSNHTIALKAGTYTIKVDLVTGKTASIYYQGDNTATTVLGSAANAQSFTLAADENISIWLYNSGGMLTSDVIKAQLESGSSATAYAPYSNISPITGWTGANVIRTGVNILDGEFENGSLNSINGETASNPNYKRTKNYIPITPNTDYYLKASDNVFVKLYDRSHMAVTGGWDVKNTKNVVVSVPSNAAYLKIVISVTMSTSEISLNFPSSDHDYHAYTGTTIPISWQSEAGTVYGGNLNVTTGVLTVMKANVSIGANSFSKSSTASSVGGSVFSYPISSLGMAPRTKYSPNTMISDYFATCGSGVWFIDTMPDNAMMSNSTALLISASEYATATAFNTAMSTANAQLVFDLATPLTYALTPQELQLLLGTNNVWADTGNTSVSYKADIQLYIQKLTGSTEEDMVANENIAADTYFMVGNTLYLSTTAITSGSTIIPGTNCTLTNLAAALNALNA